MSALSKLQAYTDALRDFRDNKERYLADSLRSRSEGIAEAQRKQLFEGKASDGQDIRPSYSEDLKAYGGFFTSPKSAKNYADWKNSLSYPYNVPRHPDSPNLYIPYGIHHFHDDLGVIVDDYFVSVIGKTAYANGIIAKYGLDTFGLTKENWRRFIHEYDFEGITIINELREKLLLSLSI